MLRLPNTLPVQPIIAEHWKQADQSDCWKQSRGSDVHTQLSTLASTRALLGYQSQTRKVSAGPISGKDLYHVQNEGQLLVGMRHVMNDFCACKGFAV